MKEKWNHFIQNDRDRIEILLNQGVLQKEIAILLRKSPSALSREISRGKNEYGIYVSKIAESRARFKRLNSKYQGMKVETNPLLQKRIVKELKQGRSPDEIAGMLNLENINIGKDAIYKWLYSVYGDKYCKHLCTRRKKKKMHKKKTKRELIPNRVELEYRPEDGIHLEADTLVSGKNTHSTESASMIVVEKTKLMIGNRISSMKPVEMLNSVNFCLEKLKNISDITLDNGIENRLHEQFKIPAYFCSPHHPWEKPLVEQSIGLLRRWFIKKGVNLIKVTEKDYQNYLNFFNHKKRKSLGYKSAYEVSLECGIISEIPERVDFEKLKVVAIEGRI